MLEAGCWMPDVGFLVKCAQYLKLMTVKFE